MDGLFFLVVFFLYKLKNVSIEYNGLNCFVKQKYSRTMARYDVVNTFFSLVSFNLISFHLIKLNLV